MTMATTRKSMHVMMTMSDGSKLEGYLTIEGYTRLSDVINNNNKDFLILLDINTQVHIVNKQHIIQIMERDEID